LKTNLNSYLLKNNFIILLILIFATYSFSSCNAVKYVPEDEHLLTKNEIYINDKKNVNDDISAYIVQRPNQSVLGSSLPLHFHNIGNRNFEPTFKEWKENNLKRFKSSASIFSEKQIKGLYNFKKNTHNWWLKNGEEPEIFSTTKAKQTVANLNQYYINEGYYKANVSYTTKPLKNKKIEVSYHVKTDKPFLIDSISTNIEAKVLDSIYKTAITKTHLKSGDKLKITSIIDEENRISDLFRNSGIYRFNKNAIAFEADSSNYKAQMSIIINDSISNLPFKIQKIKNINIYSDYSYNTKDEPKKDTVNFNGISFLSREPLKYNPKLLLNSIFIEPGQIYKDETRELTRKHLRNLNNFSSVDIKYDEIEDDFLQASIYLTPLKKYTIGFNTELTHSNIRQLGISGKLSFLNRNIFKGSEIFKFSVQGSFLDSKDAADNEKLLNAWEAGADVSLELPRFLLPFNSSKYVRKDISPKTILTLGTSFQKNIGLDKQKFTGIIDYTWESTKTKSHSLELLNAQFIKNLNIDSYFTIYKSEYSTLKSIQEAYFPAAELNETNAINFITNNIDANFELNNPTEFQIVKNIESRYGILTEDVFVPSIAYTYTLNKSENYKDLDFSFFRARIVSSGNLSTFLSSQKDENNVKTIFKTPIAQFIRTDFEYKKFWNISLENVLALRTFVGAVIPYENSNSVPFSRSYFIGGPNDLRAWKIYDLGPGSTKNGLEYNVGTLKFITSFEYRFKILNSFKGAFFIDAGNIWDITNSKLTNEKAKFNGLKSLQDIAVGTGFGIRYDLSFILLRLDLGFKTYEPYLEGNNKWFQHANFRNNIYNFGISYPF